MKKRKKTATLPTSEQIEQELHRLKHKEAYKKALQGTVNALLVVAALAVLLSSLLLPVLQISGDSMEPTLSNGEVVVLVKTGHFSTGDLCAFSFNNKILIKRIIAGLGDWVDIDRDGTVSVNGIVMDETYITDKGLGECDVEFPIQIGENQYFVMGDHRSTSIDSRSTVIGNVNTDQIIGKVVFRVWPFSEFGWIGS